MATAKVHAGDCGHSAVIEARQVSKDTVQITIRSACEMLTAMNDDLAIVKWRGKGHEVFRPIPESVIYRSAGCHIRHPGCPVPAAVIKAIEVEVGVALARDVTIHIFENGTGAELSGGAEEQGGRGEGETRRQGEQRNSEI